MDHKEIEQRLEEIFRLASESLEGRAKIIVERGFVFSKVDFNAKVIICGMNPSERNDFLTAKNSYQFQQVPNDRYFKKFNRFINDFQRHHSTTYLDLFYQRHSKQLALHSFDSEAGKKFLLDQLRLTEKIIKTINPEAILVFNKEAFSFFSSHSKLEVGLNWELKKYQKSNVWKRKKSGGSEPLLLESRFLNHFVSKQELSQIKNEVDSIFHRLR